MIDKGKRVVALLLVLLATVGCDQMTKSLAESHLSSSKPLTFLNGIVQLQVVENPGAFLSLGAGLSTEAQHWIFTIAVAILLGAALIFTLRVSLKAQTPVLIALALFLGGGIGNLIDRLTNDGRVIDFMHIGFGFLRTGVFNVADMALLTGVILLALYSYWTRSSPPLSDVAGKR